MTSDLSVKRVGVLVRGIGPDEYRARLRAWGDEDHGQPKSNEEIEAEVKRSSDQHLSFTWSMFAELNDGRRVIERETHRGMDIGRHPVVLLAPGERRPTEDELLPNHAAVQETLRRSIERESPKDRWEELVELLKAEGLKTSPRQLDKLPLDFEFDARADELASGKCGPEDFPLART